MTNLLNCTDIATVFLDTSFASGAFTPAATRLFNLIATDVGRPISDITLKFQDADLLADAQKVLRNWRRARRRSQPTTAAGAFAASFPIARSTIASRAWWSPSWTSPNASGPPTRSSAPRRRGECSVDAIFTRTSTAPSEPNPARAALRLRQDEAVGHRST